VTRFVCFFCFVLPLLNVKVLEFWLRSGMMTERDVSFLPSYSNLFCLYFLCLSPLTFLNAWDNAGTNHNSLTKIREWKVISSWKKIDLGKTGRQFATALSRLKRRRWAMNNFSLWNLKKTRTETSGFVVTRKKKEF